MRSADDPLTTEDRKKLRDLRKREYHEKDRPATIALHFALHALFVVFRVLVLIPGLKDIPLPMTLVTYFALEFVVQYSQMKVNDECMPPLNLNIVVPGVKVAVPTVILLGGAYAYLFGYVGEISIENLIVTLAMQLFAVFQPDWWISEVLAGAFFQKALVFY